MGVDHSPVRVATCDVYVAELSSLQAHHWSVLDDTERLRAGRYVYADDRDRFVLGAALLRTVAARAMRCAPEAVLVDRACGRCGEPHGKPRLVGARLETSIAHSGDIVAVALSVDGPVGVDVEARRPFDHRPLLPDVCTDDEQLLVAGLDDFYAYWTRKEAFLKATGAGLLQPMREVAVTPPGSPPAVLRVGTAAPTPSRLVDLRPADGYAGAVAVLTSLPLRCTSHDAAELLTYAVRHDADVATSRDVVAAAASGFGLNVRSARRLAAGVENVAHHVATPTGEFVLLVLTRRTPESASTYASYVDALAAAGVQTPAPLVARDGRFVVVHDGLPVIALPFVAGKSPTSLSDGELARVAGLLADVHRSDVRCPMPPRLRFTDDDLAAAAGFDDAEFGDWLLSAHDRVAAAVGDAASTTAPTHGDPFCDNVVVGDDGRIVLLDWEDGAQDTPLVDVGMAFLGHCNDDGLQPARARVILDAYRSPSDSTIEPDELLAVTTYVTLFTAFNRYRRRTEAWTRELGRSYRAAHRFAVSLPAAWPALFGRAPGSAPAARRPTA